MGTQQLLLIVVGGIIVVVAIAVGITLFESNAQNSNREQIIGDIDNLGATAQQYYRRPVSFGGGGGDFKGFALAPLDTGNRYGSFSVTTSKPSGAKYVPGSAARVGNSEKVIYIIGCGEELGNNGVDPIKAYLKVTKDSLDITILN